ncbi:MAG: hypothetical protein V4488_14715 [Pseudomonadota bacterium]
MKLGPAAAMAGVTLTLALSAVSAAPAAFYQWRSKLNGVLVCSQTSPGEGWKQAAGPYKDAQCSKLKDR